MFCSHCGVEASGNFCYCCGSPLHAAATEPAARSEDYVDATVVDVDSPPVIHWEDDASYENVVRVEAVRQAIAAHAAKARKGISGEAFLSLFDKIIASPISLETVASVAQPIYASCGMRTGKERVEHIGEPIGRVIARTLCSLAKNAQDFQHAQQDDCGCMLTAQLPSSICSLKGDLTITLLRLDAGTSVAAATNIPGQLYDWGKSRRCLDQLFADLRSDMGLPSSAGRSRAA